MAILLLLQAPRTLAAEQIAAHRRPRSTRSTRRCDGFATRASSTCSPFGRAPRALDGGGELLATDAGRTRPPHAPLAKGADRLVTVGVRRADVILARARLTDRDTLSLLNHSLSPARSQEFERSVAFWWKDDSRRDLRGLGSVLSALFGDRVQSPLARDALELVRSAVRETDPRSGYEILDRA